MTRQEKIRWLRRSYWVGAVADALTLVPMLSPKAGGAMFGIEDFDPPYEYKYAMGMGASLMAGWTLLLLWADRKPAERRGVLPLTIFPVIFGIALSGAITVARSDLVEARKMIPLAIFQAAITALFAYSYLVTRGLEKRPS
ncbi:MAG: hypothetical protein C4536_14210 [Actinobacteria bacterium]|jgi:hypothetical protein|nr:MAG: hypothetical protein C4536_14210 [Actinomycetota bacterium]